jgi:hypothetical protein
VLLLAGFAEVQTVALGNLATVDLVSQNAAASGGADSSGALVTVTASSTAGTGFGSAVGQAGLQTVTIQPHTGTAYGDAAINSEFASVQVRTWAGGAIAINPPGKAIAWTQRISHDGPTGKALAWDGPLTRATARIVRTRAAAKYLEPVA